MELETDRQISAAGCNTVALIRTDEHAMQEMMKANSPPSAA